MSASSSGSSAGQPYRPTDSLDELDQMLSTFKISDSNDDPIQSREEIISQSKFLLDTVKRALQTSTQSKDPQVRRIKASKIEGKITKLLDKITNNLAESQQQKQSHFSDLQQTTFISNLLENLDSVKRALEMLRYGQVPLSSAMVDIPESSSSSLSTQEKLANSLRADPSLQSYNENERETVVQLSLPFMNEKFNETERSQLIASWKKSYYREGAPMEEIFSTWKNLQQLIIFISGLPVNSPKDLECLLKLAEIPHQIRQNLIFPAVMNAFKKVAESGNSVSINTVCNILKAFNLVSLSKIEDLDSLISLISGENADTQNRLLACLEGFPKPERLNAVQKVLPHLKNKAEPFFSLVVELTKLFPLNERVEVTKYFLSKEVTKYFLTTLNYDDLSYYESGKMVKDLEQIPSYERIKVVELAKQSDESFAICLSYVRFMQPFSQPIEQQTVERQKQIVTSLRPILMAPEIRNDYNTARTLFKVLNKVPLDRRNIAIEIASANISNPNKDVMLGNIVDFWTDLSEKHKADIDHFCSDVSTYFADKVARKNKRRTETTENDAQGSNNKK